MQDIRIPIYDNAQTFLDRASAVASFYGFKPLDEVIRTAPRLKPKRMIAVTAGHRRLDALGGEFPSVIKKYIEHECMSLPQPLLLYHFSTQQKRNAPHLRFGLEVLGCKKSIAEALITRTALAVLEELGYTDIEVRVNSIGDGDSANRYAKELGNFVRKNMNALPAPAREAAKKDVFFAAEYLYRKQHPFKEELPRPMEYLSESSRKHLREVIEFLEIGNVPYELDDTLFGHKDCYAHTLFQLWSRTDDPNSRDRTVFARGGRFDELPRKLGRADIPAVGLVFEGNVKKIRKRVAPKHCRPRAPKVYFIQVGYEAKLRSLPVIERLRKARIPLYQTVSREKFSEQFADSAASETPYTIIMGHKEAVEGTVIIRDSSTRAQVTIPVDALPNYVKQL